MVECWLPYGRTEVHVSVPLRNLLGTAEPDRGQPVLNPREAIITSLQNPIESKGLGDLIKPGAKVAIAIDGSTTPYLAAQTISGVVETLRQNEEPTNDVSIIVGNGLRGRSDPDLMKAIQATGGSEEIDIVEHSRGSGNLSTLGTTSTGTEVEISSPFVDADVRIAVGEVLIDHFAGLRGAHSTIVPALSGHSTISHNRGLSFSGDVVPGVTEGNPVHADEMEAADMARVDFAINLVTNGLRELVSACSGNLEQSWAKAMADLGDSYKVKGEANADVIVVGAGGRRFDFDLYNAVWALNGVSAIAKRGATIILVAECSEGLGADGLQTLSEVETLSELRRRYMPGARAVHLIKSTLRRNQVVLVSALPDYLAEPLGFTVERTANAALGRVFERRRGRRTLVVTHGCSTIPFVA